MKVVKSGLNCIKMEESGLNWMKVVKVDGS